MRARFEYVYSNGDSICVHQPWDDDPESEWVEGGFKKGDPMFSCAGDWAGNTDFHPVQSMDVFSKGELVHVNIYRVGPWPAAEH